MFYYVDCPKCKNDLSRHATVENLDTEHFICTYCDSKLKLHFTEDWDEDLGDVYGIFWFEKI
jgi:transcription elongation factor Elf1